MTPWAITKQVRPIRPVAPGERSTASWHEEDYNAAFPLQRFRDEVLHVFPADRLDPYIEAATSFSGESFARIAMNRSP